MAGAGAQQAENFTHDLVLSRLGRRRRIGCRLRQVDVAEVAEVAPQVGQLVRHLRCRQYKVGKAGVDGCARHAGLASILGRLHQHHPALVLHQRQAADAVHAGATQDHRHRARPVRQRQRAHELVDRHRRPARFTFAHAQVAVVHLQRQIGRNDIHRILFHVHRPGDRHHRHAGGTLQDGVGITVVDRRQMHDHHVSGAGIDRRMCEEIEQRLDATGRRADADHRELLGAAHDLVLDKMDALGGLIGRGHISSSGKKRRSILHR